MNAKVADLMTAEVVGIQRHHTVEHAREMMRRHGIHALPVVDPDGTPAGIVSSQDLAAELKNETPISNVMTQEVFTIRV